MNWLWTAVRAYILIALYNGVAHAVWAILIVGYNPGLVSAVLTLPLASYLGYALYHAKPVPLQAD